ncbi:hypothetical protein [Pseudomonas moraviensis]|uniref:hypothetical protein n=1 Tax=Pseudomonas moraviensis TaxID=321662 RepID=UPI0011471792|nr:hypothetical protein [Pseudomonas moraviensis]
MNPLNYFEFTLANWAWGAQRSEQMCTKLLILCGYTDATPQAPRGGPDGGKDIVFTHYLGKGIAACYFPHSPSSFTDIKNKFTSDLAKAKSNGAKCFFFMTGQRLSMGQRTKIVAGAGLPVYILDHDYIIPRHQEVSEFVGETKPANDNSKSITKEKNDAHQLTLLIRRCKFFDLVEDLDRAPYRFGSSIVEKDELNELFEKKIVHFYDPSLKKLVDEWWMHWSNILILTRWNFDMMGGEIYLPKDHIKYLDNTYLSELEAASSDFAIAHDKLLTYAREKFPEVFLPVVDI